LSVGVSEPDAVALSCGDWLVDPDANVVGAEVALAPVVTVLADALPFADAEDDDVFLFKLSMTKPRPLSSMIGVTVLPL
jgi:hypothetical protein